MINPSISVYSGKKQKAILCCFIHSKVCYFFGSRVNHLRLYVYRPVVSQCENHWTKILQDLEVLQEISAGHFVASDLLLYQSVRGQEERDQLGQRPLKFPIDV